MQPPQKLFKCYKIEEDHLFLKKCYIVSLIEILSKLCKGVGGQMLICDQLWRVCVGVVGVGGGDSDPFN